MEYKLSDQKVYDKLNKTFFIYVNNNHKKILDVGCGNGDNAKLIKTKFPAAIVDGITISSKEKNYCQKIMRECYLIDISKGDLSSINNKYDLIFFSHVLEHIAYPKNVLDQFNKLLNPEGKILIIVPNVMHYINRFNLIRGRFNYTKRGILDFTHLRFFTYNSVINLLVNNEIYSVIKFEPQKGTSTQSIIYKILRKKITTAIDKMAIKMFPNLFAEELVLLLNKRISSTYDKTNNQTFIE